MARVLLLLVLCISSLQLQAQTDTPPAASEAAVETEKKAVSSPPKATVRDVLAQQQDQAALEILPTGLDEYNRDVPRTAIATFLRLGRDRDFEQAAELIDFRNLPKDIASIPRERIAYELYKVLDNAVWIDLDEVSDLPEGNLDDQLPSYRERLARLEIGGKYHDILLQRVPTADKNRVWKISNATVRKVPELYGHYGNNPLGEWLEQHVPNKKFLNVHLWQWSFFLLTFIGVYGALVPATLLSFWLIQSLRGEHPNNDSLKRYINGPLRLFIAVVVYRMLLSELQMPVAVRALWEGSTLLILAWWWLLLRSLDLYIERLRLQWAKIEDSPMHLLNLGSTGGKIAISLTLALIWLERLGFSASTVLAGLGIGGIAVALAAQKTVENVIGAVILYSSKPVKVGQLCRFGQYLGVVEEIGLRSSTIRTLQRTIINIPNAKLADSELENISQRESIRYFPLIRVQYGASSEQLKKAVTAIGERLLAHELINEDGLRVHLAAFSDWGHEIEIQAYIATTDFNTYMDVSEEANLAIIDILAEHELQLARGIDLSSG